jgi:hypothetical protein
MGIVGGSTSGRWTHRAIGASAAVLIAWGSLRATAIAASASAAADTAAAAALYEPVAPNSGSSTAPATSAAPSSGDYAAGASGAADPTAGAAGSDGSALTGSAAPDADPADAASLASPPDASTPSGASASAPDAETPLPTVNSPSSSPASPHVTTKTVIVPASMPAPAYVKAAAAPASTTEIPQSANGPGSSNDPASAPVNDPSSAGDPGSSNDPGSSDAQPGTAEIDNQATNSQIITYEQAQQNPQRIDPQLHSLQEFINEGDESSPLGVQLREDQRKLDDGEVANGLLIVGVDKHSAAANAGLHPLRRTGHDVAEGLAIAAAMFFPPAVLAVPIVASVNMGETYDMIIGVDGSRVTNYLDFEDRMRDIQPGEIVYLSIVRNGQRVQVPVHVQ